MRQLISISVLNAERPPPPPYVYTSTYTWQFRIVDGGMPLMQVAANWCKNDIPHWWWWGVERRERELLCVVPIGGRMFKMWCMGQSEKKTNTHTHSNNPDQVQINQRDARENVLNLVCIHVLIHSEFKCKTMRWGKKWANFLRFILICGLALRASESESVIHSIYMRFVIETYVHSGIQLSSFVRSFARSFSHTSFFNWHSIRNFVWLLLWF